MIRFVLRLFYGSVLAGSLLALSACSGSSSTNSPVPSAEEKQALLNQQLSAMQEQAARLNKQLADLHVDQDQRLKNLTASSQQLSAQILEFQRQLLPGAPAVKPAPAVAPASALNARPAAPQAAPAPPPRAESGSSWGEYLIRLILIVMILAAAIFMVRFFLGRWGEEENEEDDFDTDVAEDELPFGETTGEGAAPAKPHLPPAGDAAVPTDQPKTEETGGERKS